MKNIASHKYSPKDFSAGQVHEMLVTLGKEGFSPEMAAFIANAKSGKAKEVVGLFLGSDFAGLISEWQKFYQMLFGIEADFSDLQIPQKQAGFDRLIIVTQSMASQRLYDKCRELFPCWKYTDKNLDEIVTSDRSSKNGSYAVWVHNRVEADEELKNLSANDLKEKGVAGITLEERLVYELKYFSEVGQHLDVENITLCSGSRCRGGGVPGVYGYVDELYVGWCDSVGAFGYLRSRQAVS